MPGSGLDAVVLAGGPLHVDAVCRHAGVDRKSLIRIAGRQMLLYVLQALAEAGQVGHAAVVGVRRDELTTSTLPLPATFVAGGDSPVKSALAGLALAQSEQVLLCASDLPLLTERAVSDFLDRCAAVEADFCYAIVERTVMEARFPGSGRHFRPLRDGWYAGGDVLLVRPAAFQAKQRWFDQMFQARKSCLRLLSLLGWDTLLDFLLRRLTLASLEKRLSAVLGGRCKAIISPFAEIAMDVDTIHQLELVSHYIASHHRETF